MVKSKRVIATTLMGVGAMYLLINLFVVQIERNHLKQGIATFQHETKRLFKLVELKFSHANKNKMTPIYSRISSTPIEQEIMGNELELNTLMRCSFSRFDQGKANKLPVNTYNAIPFQPKAYMDNLCSNIRELDSIVGLSDYVGFKQVFFDITIDEPHLLFTEPLSAEDGVNLEELTASHEKWLLYSNFMPENHHENSADFHEVSLFIPETLGSLFKINVWIHKSLTSYMSPLFFYNYADIFDVTKAFKHAVVTNGSGLVIDEATITINWPAYMKYQPLFLLMALLLSWVVYRVFRVVIAWYNLGKTLSMADYGLVKFDSSGKFHVVKDSGVFSRLNDEYEVEFFDSQLVTIKSPAKATFVNVRSEEALLEFSISASTFIKASQKQGYLVLTEASTTQQSIKNFKEIHRMDALTQLPNRAALDYFIRQYEHSKVTFVMGIVDLDHFKKVNDGFGHHFGDLVLKHAAEHLKETIRLEESDRIIRLGGEEFLILIASKHSTYDEVARSIAKRVLEFNSENLSFSAGFGMWQPNEAGFDSAYKNIDKLLYRAKEQGRRQAHVQLASNEVIILPDNQHSAAKNSNVAELAERANR